MLLDFVNVPQLPILPHTAIAVVSRESGTDPRMTRHPHTAVPCRLPIPYPTTAAHTAHNALRQWLTWGQIWDHIPDIPSHFASSAFGGLKISILVCVPGQEKPCTFDQKWWKFCIDDVIWPWKCWPKVTNFSSESGLMWAYPALKEIVYLRKICNF